MMLSRLLMVLCGLFANIFNVRSICCKHSLMDPLAATQQSSWLLYNKTEQLNIFISPTTIRHNCVACTSLNVMTNFPTVAGVEVSVMLPYYICLTKASECNKNMPSIGDFKIKGSCKPKCCPMGDCTKVDINETSCNGTSIEESALGSKLDLFKSPARPNDGFYCYVGDQNLQFILRCSQGEKCAKISLQGNREQKIYATCSKQFVLLGALLAFYPNIDLCSSTAISLLETQGQNITCCDSDLCNAFGPTKGKTPFEDLDKMGKDSSKVTAGSCSIKEQTLVGCASCTLTNTFTLAALVLLVAFHNFI